MRNPQTRAQEWEPKPAHSFPLVSFYRESEGKFRKEDSSSPDYTWKPNSWSTRWVRSESGGSEKCGFYGLLVFIKIIGFLEWRVNERDKRREKRWEKRKVQKQEGPVVRRIICCDNYVWFNYKFCSKKKHTRFVHSQVNVSSSHVLFAQSTTKKFIILKFKKKNYLI